MFQDRIVFILCSLIAYSAIYLHFSQGHSERHAKKVWSFRGKISTFFPWNFSFSVTGNKIKRLFLAYNWKIIPVGPYSCLLCNLKKTGHSERHPPVLLIDYFEDVCYINIYSFVDILVYHINYLYFTPQM